MPDSLNRLPDQTMCRDATKQMNRMQDIHNFHVRRVVALNEAYDQATTKEDRCQIADKRLNETESYAKLLRHRQLILDRGQMEPLQLTIRGRWSDDD